VFVRQVEVKKKVFFLKKEAKTFIQYHRNTSSAERHEPKIQIDKVFLLLFVHKKKILPCC